MCKRNMVVLVSIIFENFLWIEDNAQLYQINYARYFVQSRHSPYKSAARCTKNAANHCFDRIKSK